MRNRRDIARVGPETETSSGCALAGSQNKPMETSSPTTPAASEQPHDDVCPPVCGNSGTDASGNTGGLSRGSRCAACSTKPCRVLPASWQSH